ncbi:hypothetical protein L7F22_024035 [Adiantum nelumboides]|nr:hypothetical protein [Adiantum nelumboides]
MDKWRRSDMVDAVLAPVSIALLLAYHIFLFYKVRTRPMQTRMGINHKARRLWVYDMLNENHKKNVLVVQTLRNSIMESTLMATTAVLLTAGLATYFTFGSTLKQLPGGSEGTPLSSISLTSPISVGTVSSTIKTFAVLSCFMVSFLCHTQSIRFINHVNYMVNIPMDHLITANYVADLMERGTFMYSMVLASSMLPFLFSFGFLVQYQCSYVLLYSFMLSIALTL